MRRAFETFSHRLWLALALVFGAVQQPVWSAPTQACTKPVYLTFDTGHMGVAPLVADVLRRQQVRATFFMANERTLNGGSSLDDQWAPWWRDRAQEGHAFGSHTWDHEVWQADALGRYAHPADPRGSNSTFKGFGRCGTGTDPTQRFWFDTIKPGAPAPGQAPHLNVIVTMRGMLLHAYTRIYFPDEPANATDPVLALVPADRRDTLVAVKREGNLYQFDIHMQTAGLTHDYTETVVRGAADSSKFSVFYYRGGRLTAVDSINQAAEHMTARKLIGARANVTPAQAADSIRARTTP